MSSTKKKRDVGAKKGARAMWKGEVQLAKQAVPVKLYAAAVERSKLHFRLLHHTDLTPVKQRSVHGETGEEVSSEEVQRAFVVEKDTVVVLDDDELEGSAPEPSRAIEVLAVLPAHAVPEPFYLRPYHVGPDGDAGAYLALVEALRRAGQLALVRWVMRGKRYVGALAPREGRLLLTTLRSQGEVVLVEDLPAPGGRALDAKERALAEQLVSALEGPFEPEEFHEEYTRKVHELVAAKAHGKKPRLRAPKAKPKVASLASALRKSVEAARKHGGKERDVA
jgi:DNA end-binding protein Ku